MDTSPKGTYALLKKIDKLSIYRARTLKWLSSSTDEQRSYIYSVFADFESKPTYEQNILRSILLPFCRTGNECDFVVHDALALYRSFLVPKVRNSDRSSHGEILRLVIGLRESVGMPLDLSTPEKKRDMGALLAFTFEVSGRGTEVLSNYIFKDESRTMFSRLKDPALKPLVFQYPEKVETLMHYYLTRSTDAGMLAVLMAEDNVTAFNDGLL